MGRFDIPLETKAGKNAVIAAFPRKDIGHLRDSDTESCKCKSETNRLAR